ncbi:MAG TPA: hypothetical protein VK528_08800 [Flavobacterium sp.]|nr:hypothetical protein [Flavobacterium sp.]
MDHSDKEYNEFHNDPSNWIWGIFYFNKKDDRIFVSKHLPIMGITLNFANPYTPLVIFAFAMVIYFSGK